MATHPGGSLGAGHVFVHLILSLSPLRSGLTLSLFHRRGDYGQEQPSHFFTAAQFASPGGQRCAGDDPELQVEPPRSTARLWAPPQARLTLPGGGNYILKGWCRNLSWRQISLCAKRVGEGEREKPRRVNPQGLEPGQRDARVLCLRDLQSGLVSCHQVTPRVTSTSIEKQNLLSTPFMPPSGFNNPSCSQAARTHFAWFCINGNIRNPSTLWCLTSPSQHKSCEFHCCLLFVFHFFLL